MLVAVLVLTNLLFAASSECESQYSYYINQDNNRSCGYTSVSPSTAIISIKTITAAVVQSVTVEEMLVAVLVLTNLLFAASSECEPQYSYYINQDNNRSCGYSQ
ncbi:hypothetical protein J6590_078818 [Homalodisca vitripennis]|nr:hypothetical protein J6590_078818 [Homalodisca vitripennis]